MRRVACIAYALMVVLQGNTTVPIYAQTPKSVTLKGIVLDSSSAKPVIGAMIVIQELNKRDVTHRDGSFHFINFPPGNYTLSIRQLGYHQALIPCSIHSDTTLTLYLGALHYTVGGASVTAERSQISTSATRMADEIPLVELDKHRGQTLGQALEQTAGVTLLQTGPSIAKPVIRGLHSSRIVVVNNGLAQEGQQWGAEHAPEIDPFSPAKIEVLKGAAGVEYGAGALGGVIRIAPRTLHFNVPWSGEFISNGFSNNEQGAFSLALNGGSLPFVHNGGWRAQLSWRKAGDSQTPQYLLSNTGFRELSGSVAFGTKGEVYGLESSYSYFSTELGILSASHIGNLNDLNRAIESGSPLIIRDFSYAIQSPKQEIEHHSIAFRGYYSTSIGKWEAQYGWQLNDRSEFDAHNSRISDSSVLQSYLSRPAMGLLLATYTFDLKLHHHEIGNLSGTVGIGALRQRNTRSGRVLLIPDYTSYNLHAFAVENYTVGNWIANAGLRFDQRFLEVTPLDRNTGSLLADTLHTFGGVTASLGLLHQIDDGVSIALNCSSGWRPPNVNELYSNDVHHGSAQFEIGSAALQPERSTSVDASLHLALSTIKAEASVYANSIAKYIFLLPDKEHPTVTIRGVFPTMYYAQANALLYGAETRCEIPLAAWCNSVINYSMVRGDNQSTNEPLIFMPADRLRTTLHLHSEETWGISKPYIEATALFVAHQSRFPAGVDYTAPPPGYTLYSVAAGGVVEVLGTRLTLNIEVQNLLNTPYRDYLSRYRYFALDAGRNIILRFSIPFGSDNPDTE